MFAPAQSRAVPRMNVFICDFSFQIPTRIGYSGRNRNGMDEKQIRAAVQSRVALPRPSPLLRQRKRSSEAIGVKRYPSLRTYLARHGTPSPNT